MSPDVHEPMPRMSVTTMHERATDSATRLELAHEVYEEDRSIGRQSEEQRRTPWSPPTDTSGQVDDTYDEGVKPTKPTHVSEARYERLQDAIAEGNWQRGPSQSWRTQIEEFDTVR